MGSLVAAAVDLLTTWVYPMACLWLLGIGLLLLFSKIIVFVHPSYRAKVDRLKNQLEKIHRFPKRYVRLLSILMSTREYRLETLWENISIEQRDDIIKTKIPKKLRHMAKTGSKRQRERAILILGLLRDRQSLGMLRTQAASTDHRIALAAIKALGRFDDVTTGRFLLSLLSSRFPINGSRVATVLEGMRVDLEQPLIENLDLGDPSSRFWAATLLGRFNTAPSRAALMRALKDDDANVRAAALDSLALVGSVQEASAVTGRLQDPVWFVRAHAALACGHMVHSASIHRLVGLLSDAVWWVRYDAAKAIKNLMRYGDRVLVVETLLKHVDAEDTFAREQVAALLSNNGVVDSLVDQLNRDDLKAVHDARRLLTMIYAAGGAPRLKERRDWRREYARVKGVFRT